jgi:hypothetical protein
VAEATRIHSDNGDPAEASDWTQGYGYQFWRCRHNAYRGDGAFGQFCVVLPQQDAVLAIVSGLRDMQAVLDKVWAHLLPAMQPQPLPADPQAQAALAAKLRSLALPLVTGDPLPRAAHTFTGKTYALDANGLQLQSITLAPHEGGSTVVIADVRGQHRVEAGFGVWHKGRADLRGRGEEPIAACGAWTAADTYELRICCYESEICPLLRLHFRGDELRLEYDPNVAWVGTEVVTIVGRAVGAGA